MRNCVFTILFYFLPIRLKYPPGCDSAPGDSAHKHQTTVNSHKHDPPGSTKVGLAQISEVGGPTFHLPVSEARGLLALGPAPLVLVRVVVGALVRGRVGVKVRGRGGGRGRGRGKIRVG